MLRVLACFGACSLFIFTALSRPVIAQSKPAISGNVLTKSGEPLASVDVWGSAWKECCPVEYEHVTTGAHGEFTLMHKVQILHFSKEGLQPLTVVVSTDSPALHIIMEPATDSLVLRPCVPPQRGERQIPGRNFDLNFTVAPRAVKVSGGKPDVDYVEYVVKPKNGHSSLELWFGPYATSWEPDEKQFVNSVEFAQRSLVLPDGGTIGIDSWGRFRDGTSWRQADIVGEGARYTDADPADTKFFDEIINSACFTPYSPH